MWFYWNNQHSLPVFSPLNGISSSTADVESQQLLPTASASWFPTPKPFTFITDVVPNSLSQRRSGLIIWPRAEGRTGMQQTAFKTTELYTILKLPASIKVAALSNYALYNWFLNFCQSCWSWLEQMPSEVSYSHSRAATHVVLEQLFVWPGWGL